VTVTVDGTPSRVAAKGEMLIKAAQEEHGGVHPRASAGTKGMKPVGMCRMCLVDGRRPCAESRPAAPLPSPEGMVCNNAERRR